jgi:ABC-type transport system involved in Fe-S cluster assembly fused permease/ATPase subunit
VLIRESVAKNFATDSRINTDKLFAHHFDDGHDHFLQADAAVLESISVIINVVVIIIGITSVNLWRKILPRIHGLTRINYLLTILMMGTIISSRLMPPCWKVFL